MEDTTIISYSRSRIDSLLCLTESRSRYMLPFGGKFRVVDFTIHNAIFSGARKTVIYNDCEDELEEYVNNYGNFGDPGYPALKVVSREFSDIGFCYNLVMDCNTSCYIIYNGDNPSIIDFTKILDKFKKTRAKAALFKLKIDNSASMAHTVLVATQKYLLNTIKQAIKENRVSPNIFEMIINIMINNGIKKNSADAYYWPMKTIPDYYKINMKILKDPAISSLIYGNSPIRSFIKGSGDTILGPNAKVAGSIISDNCKIHGKVLNSIIYPGVEIGENAFVQESIILPNTIIGPGAIITKTIIDERTDIYTETGHNGNYLNIGRQCTVGTSDGQMKNNEFSSLNSSLTLIGKNCRIPDNSRIGGACYIASGKGSSYFEKNKHLYNGLSIIN